MPIARIEMWPGRSEEKKERLIANVTEAISSTLEIPEEDVQVILIEVPRNHWARAGVPYAKKEVGY